MPKWVVNAESVVKFDSNLDKVWKNQEHKFDYRARITTIATIRAQSYNNNRDNELES